MDYGGLKAEIAKSVYNGMTDAQIVTALNAPTPGPSVPAPLSSILDYLRTNNLWLAIKAAAAASPPNEGAVAAADLFGDVHTTAIDLTLPAAQTLMTALVSGGLLTSAEVTALTAISQTTTTIAKNYGFANGVTVAELAAARIWPGVSST